MRTARTGAGATGVLGELAREDRRRPLHVLRDPRERRAGEDARHVDAPLGAVRRHRPPQLRGEPSHGPLLACKP